MRGSTNTVSNPLRQGLLAAIGVLTLALVPVHGQAQEDLLYVIERVSGQELSTVDGNNTVTLLTDNLEDPLFVARLDNGNLLVTERGGGGLLTEIDPATGVEISSTNPGFQPNELLVEGSVLWVTTFDGRLMKSDNGTGGPFMAPHIKT